MPPTPIVVLEIDDNTRPDLAPFSHDLSVSSFHHGPNLNLHTRTAAATFRVIHEALGGRSSRGDPERVTRATRELLDDFADAEEVAGFTGEELASVHPYLPTGDTAVGRTLRMLFDTVEVAGHHFGPDRVRLVFAVV
jgi:hypothetical protein